MHYSVLLKESIAYLNIKPDGFYVDGTFGRGGHSLEILKNLNASGHLIAIDKDPEAVSCARNLINDQRFQIIHSSFAVLEGLLPAFGVTKCDGILLDLGVSSPQLDVKERGFSFSKDAPLDMRMDNTTGMTGSQWINAASEEELALCFFRYGEERFSRKIARAIVKNREQSPFYSTLQLADFISKIVGTKEDQHPATRVFQAIRIYINHELADLETLLDSVTNILKPGGRVVVISFHSLEDRIVKTKFNYLAKGEELPKWVLMNNPQSEFKVIAKKIKAGNEELSQNRRSRSAIMRVLERQCSKL